VTATVKKKLEETYARAALLLLGDVFRLRISLSVPT